MRLLYNVTHCTDRDRDRERERERERDRQKQRIHRQTEDRQSDRLTDKHRHRAPPGRQRAAPGQLLRHI